MSCFGNLAPGAAEVQMPNESNSGVVMHPKSKHERSSALRVSALARAPARIGLEFTSRTSLARSSNSCRIAARTCDELDRRSRCASPATAVFLGGWSAPQLREGRPMRSRLL